MEALRDAQSDADAGVQQREVCGPRPSVVQ